VDDKEVSEVKTQPKLRTHESNPSFMSLTALEEDATRKHQNRIKRANWDRESKNKKLDLRHIKEAYWTPSKQAQLRSKSRRRPGEGQSGLNENLGVFASRSPVRQENS